MSKPYTAAPRERTARKPRAALPKPKVMWACPKHDDHQTLWTTRLFASLGNRKAVSFLVIPMPSAASARARAKFEALTWLDKTKYMAMAIHQRRGGKPHQYTGQDCADAEAALRAAGHRREP